MSGHSKWSTIKRKKEATDIARGKLFSKLSRAITVAAKAGGGDDPEMNPKLRMAIDTAKAANMPKDNIKRAIERASKVGEEIEEVKYEGFGPEGIGVIVEAATDNRNRTAQEIKNLFEKKGGSLGGPGAVSFNFDRRGLIVVDKNKDTDEQLLELIDVGAEDVEIIEDAIEVYVEPTALHDIAENVREKGFNVRSADIVYKPKSLVKINDKTKTERVLNFLEKLEDQDDVQSVFSNVDIKDDTQ